MKTYEVVYYETKAGKRVVEEFIQSQPEKMRAKISMEIALLQDYGGLLREPYSKHLDDGIFELRSKVGTDTTRLLYFFDRGKIVVLTNGFAKTARKTPAKELRLAKKRRKDYLKRSGQR